MNVARFVRPRIALAAIALAMIMAAIFATRGQAVDPRYAQCPVESGTVAMSFPISRASDFRAAIPGMTGKTPELEANDEPAYIVIFEGSVTLPAFGGPAHDVDGNVVARPRSYEGVVCVVVGGNPIIYYGVDTAGAHALN